MMIWMGSFPQSFMPAISTENAAILQGIQGGAPQQAPALASSWPPAPGPRPLVAAAKGAR
jgi:hypothetical protein